MSGHGRRSSIVHVVGNLGLGGGQKLTALTAAGLHRLGHDVTVISLGPAGPYERYLRGRGVPVVSLGMRKGRNLSSLTANLIGVVKLWFLLLKRRWEIVHTHMFLTAIVTLPPARLAGSRVFGTSHRIYYPRWQPRIERALSRWQEAIVVDSTAVREILREQTRIPPDKYFVIHNGIDPEEFLPIPEKADARRRLDLPDPALLVTCVAHLAPHKGQGHLLEAFAELAPRFPQAHLLLVGDGPLRHPLSRRAAELGLSDRIHLPGAREELASILAASDVLVLASVYEGFGIVQAEAMHLGLPVIGTNHGGSTEVIEEGLTGYLVPFGDVGALAGRLDILLSDPDLRREMGSAGKRRADSLFTQQAMARRYTELYARDRGDP